MILWSLVILGLAALAAGEEKVSIIMAETVKEPEVSRDARDLTSVFPFVGGEKGVPRPLSVNRHSNHHHAHRHRQHQGHEIEHAHADSAIQFARQRQQRPPVQDNSALDIGTIARAGQRCIDKEEECEENFKKSCFIEYSKQAVEEEVRFCHTPLVCEGEGPTECKTVYESVCETRYHEHDVEDDVVECETINEEKCEDVTQGYTTEQKCTKWPRQVCRTERKRVKKYSPETECKKVPRELCGPSGCEYVQGPEQCFDKKETAVQEVPEETCNLEPQRVCKHVTKLVPLLKPREECVDIPKEVCSRSRRNPRKVQKPVVKRWCYVPTEESGLAA